MYIALALPDYRRKPSRTCSSDPHVGLITDRSIAVICTALSCRVNPFLRFRFADLRFYHRRGLARSIAPLIGMGTCRSITDLSPGMPSREFLFHRFQRALTSTDGHGAMP